MCQGGMEAPPAATRRANDGRSVEKPTMVAPCRIGEAAAPGRDSSSATHFRSVNFRTGRWIPRRRGRDGGRGQLSSMALLRAHGWRKIAAALRLNARDATPMISLSPSPGAVGKAQTTSGQLLEHRIDVAAGHRAGSTRRQRSAGALERGHARSFPDEGSHEVSVPIIMAETATYFDVTIEDLTGSSRADDRWWS